MKKSIITFCLLLAIKTLSIAGNPEIFNAIMSGNAENLSKYFEESVEVCINNSQEIYSKQDAIQVIQQFLKNNKPVSIKEAHQGASKNSNSKYTIANLQTASGSYRVYIFIKNHPNKTIIQEIRFDK